MDKDTALYLRVSHRDQSHASQMPDLERWAEAHDGRVEWFRDTFTGRTMDRPGMDRLLVELRAGRLCRIVVWRLDRLGRTTRGLCQLFEELQEKKVDLVSLKDGFSLASPAGRLHARILASVAEYETEIGLSVSMPVSRLHDARGRLGAARRRAGGGRSVTNKSRRSRKCGRRGRRSPRSPGSRGYQDRPSTGY